MTDALEEPARLLPGLQKAPPGSLETLGIATVGDLLRHFPRRHEDRRSFRPVASLRDGELATVRGRVVSARLQRIRGRLSCVRAGIEDDSGSIEVSFWNQPWLAKSLLPGTEMVLFGKVRRGGLSGPEYEILHEDDALHVGRIVPIYPLTKGVSNLALRRAMSVALERLGVAPPEFLPAEILDRRGLPPFGESLRILHFPPDFEALANVRRRFAYEELLLYEMAVAAQRRRARSATGIAHKWSGELDRRIRRRLPFALTPAQDRAVREILADLRSREPMNRLLQGDVGSGKTAVALYAALVAIANRTQVAFLAPTEILARQHLATVARILEGSEVRVELLVGSTAAAARRRLLEDLASGAIDLLLGTHALLEPTVEFRRLGLVIVDEQHRFGVEQRAALIRKGVRPDVLVMTATPIPRTLALTAFGDLDVSTIDALPPGRTPAKTRVLWPSQAGVAWTAVREEAARGGQAYVIFPLVEESEEVDAKAAEEGFRNLCEGELRGIEVGLVTGRTPPAEKERIMERFRSGALSVLVGTTVLEVGLDVPNANVIVVENAERFGLSTLHQLRGRVGRGGRESRCFLLAGARSAESRERLRVMEATHDGFRIAEEDLKQRGPGEFFGTRQHGLPEFRVADVARDFALVSAARDDAFDLLAKDPRLDGAPRLREEFRRRYAGRFQLYEVG